MQKNNLILNPPITYSLMWLLIGFAIILCIALWYGFVFWFTRKKQVKQITDLKPIADVNNIDGLKQKYIAIIEEHYREYERRSVSLRVLHNNLSMDVRMFVYEAQHFPAPKLTLSDLKKASFPRLTKIIEDYYGKEFSLVEHGDALSATSAAKDMVRQWV